ncbi:MAG: LytTR family transcriptional regulator [Salibacteraceae bacterium]|nr:LytTR family transcriptional regulator [Salibacteraceae bacterium]MDP4842958.1 LytTR family transcriptional regulator [Salibacteraceae bacterium]MDP4933747.1 LytTR family transcriptional regulator [Salibacteraceae bacterium]MDP4963579.1 LytTR family transcriptional regulator [Salibacteraceae bacterium]
MLKRIQSYLNQPYPFNSNPKSYLKVVFTFTFFIAFFLIMFKPFGMNLMPGNQAIWTALGFAGVTFFSMLGFLGLTLMFPNYFHDDNWTLGRDFSFSLINFIVIGHANYFYINSSVFGDEPLMDYSAMIIGTFAVGFFPYTFLLLTKHISKLRVNTQSANELNDGIHHDKDLHSTAQSATVEFSGENEGDKLVLALEKMLYVQSSGNYIEVVYNDGAHVNKSILRNSISNVEELLASYANVYRCHRKYLVNLDRIEEVLGNSQGYRLVMDKDVEDIPVARGKNVEFKAKMSTLHT